MYVQEAGLPDGVYNVVQGEGETGALLTQHQGCSKLSFTGILFHLFQGASKSYCSVGMLNFRLYTAGNGLRYTSL